MKNMVVYTNGNETLICLEGKAEKEMLKEYFCEGSGRKTDEYDRSVVAGVVEIKSRMNISGSRIVE